jgi:hypothetical protein
MFTGPQIVTNGLVLYLDAGNSKSYPTTGTTWYDRSGNGRNGTLTNGPTYNSANGGSIVFDGIDDCIISTPPPFTSLTNSLSFNFWVYPTGNSTSSQTILSRDTNTGTPHILIRRTNSLNLTWNYSNGISAQNFSINDVFLDNLNKWVNLQITSNYITGLVTTYRNGILLNESTMTTPVFPNTNAILYVSSFVFSGFLPWTGNIGVSSIYDRILTSQEVLQNFNATKSRYGL